MVAVVTAVALCSFWWHCVHCGGTAVILFIMVPLWLYCVRCGGAVVTAMILCSLWCHCGHCCGNVFILVALRWHCGGGTEVIVVVAVTILRSL